MLLPTDLSAKNKSYIKHVLSVQGILYPLIAGCFFIVLTYRLLLVFFPSANTGGAENAILYFTQRLIAGETLYTDPAQPPYAIAQYTPVYYYLLAFVSKLVSVQDSDVLQLFILNRSLCLVLDLCTCFLIARMLIGVFETSRANAYFAAAIAFVFIVPWNRTDNLSVFFWMAALFSFLKFMISSQRFFYLVLAAVFSALCVFSKQSGLTIVVIISLWLIISGMIKDAIVFTSLFCLLVVGLIIAITTNSSLNDFYRNVILGVDNGISFRNYQSLFLHHYLTTGLASIVCFIVALLFLAKEKASLLRFLLFALVAQFIFFNLLALKIGSGINYLAEWLLLVIIAISLYADRLDNILSKIGRPAATIILCIIVIVKAAAYIKPMRWYATAANFQLGKKYFKEEKNVARYVSSHLQTYEYAMTNIPSPGTYFSDLLRKKLLFPQSDVANSVYTRHVYDLSGFKSQVNAHSVKYFVVQEPIERFQYFDVSFDNLVEDTSTKHFIVYRLYDSQR